MKEIFVQLPGQDRSYRILLEAGLRFRLDDYLTQVCPNPRVWVVSDALVARLYGSGTVALLKNRGIQASLLTVPRGEKSKSWPVLSRLVCQLLEQGADRQSLLVALGGGVIGDLTGFLASIFMRGIPFVQVPTTLLAMVDAGIGGKTAINLPAGKNLIGTFHQPRLVLIDPEFLLTLPARERRNGLAEVIKAGFIHDLDLLVMLSGPGQTLWRDRQLRNRDLLAEIIGRAVAIKARVVAEDEKEGDRRRILNFGHTVGHALEKASGFKIKHGEAVAMGMAAALDFSVELTGLSPAEASQGKELLRSQGLPLRPPSLSREEVLGALQMDKKRQADHLVFILLRHLGEAVIYPKAPLTMISDWLRA
ncbi:3-dehydroquinate synthase [Desulfobacca acetoxidans]|uniref:3-dehydroquinate synthase n=1 Tax=Desulfobacca acetoxidans (strain ATCC 700848 / DSM 11109 / ASRB2) TaxID=880072 RepID=F2NH27_DESAR|nr:3-dehydroquinate synthase [Desulfobacca acetoxidans]AEB08798.1 3-dehydroquinate synthase [Desulfobacca acetoxidans DSM 11109]